MTKLDGYQLSLHVITFFYSNNTHDVSQISPPGSSKRVLPNIFVNDLYLNTSYFIYFIIVTFFESDYLDFHIWPNPTLYCCMY